MKTPPLNTIVTDIDQTHILGHRFESRYMATEFVVTEPKFVIPQIEKAWPLNLWLINGKLHDYDALPKGPSFEGTCALKDCQLWITEVWHKTGSDGHTENIQVGWVYTVGKDGFNGNYPYDPSHADNRI
jgi:hypothetical protein